MAATRVGEITIFHAGYDQAWTKEVARRELLRQLAAAKRAYQAGNSHGLLVALALLRDHAPKRRLPKWLVAGLITDLETRHNPVSGQCSQKSVGRHAREATKRRDDAVDAVRAMHVFYLLVHHQMSENAAFNAASETLGGDAGGTAKTMMRAFKRVQQRVRDDPSRYYPLL